MGNLVLYLLIAFVVFAIIVMTVLPLILKKQLVNKAVKFDVSKSSYYEFKVTPLSYGIKLFLGVFLFFVFTLMPGYLYLVYSMKSVGESIFVCIVALFGFLSLILTIWILFKIYPKVVVRIQNESVYYNDGRNEYSFKKCDIVKFEYQEYVESFYWYMLLTIRGFEKVISLHILTLNSPHKIMAILNLINES